MSYRLALQEPVADETRRAAREQLEDAIAGLRDRTADRATAVHEARKAVKKARGLLRLVAPDLPRAAFRRENRALRDAGRLLSGARDADVMRDALAALAKRRPGVIGPSTEGALSVALAARAVNDGRSSDPSEEAADALEEIVGRIDSWPLERVDAATLVRGLERAYARGRKALAAVPADPTVQALHDWRKRVKDLWYHERLLRELWPAVLKAHAGETKHLSEHLGDDHDLAVLAELLPGDGDLQGLIAERRAELQDLARSLGARVFADKPKAVRRRTRRWEKAAR